MGGNLKPRSIGIREECAYLGYKGQYSKDPRFWSRVTRHTSWFINNTIWNVLSENDRTESIKDPEELAQKFLKAKCECTESGLVFYNGKSHGEVLWPATRTARIGSPERLTYPEDEERILYHMSRLLFKQYETKIWNFLHPKSEKVKASYTLPKIIPGTPDEDSEDDVAELPSSRDVQGHSKGEASRKLRSTEKDAIDKYLGSIYPPLREHNTQNDLALAQDLVSLLLPDNDEWLKNTSPIIEKYLHDNKFYPTREDTDLAKIKELVDILRARFKLDPEEAQDKLIASKCLEFIIKCTRQWNIDEYLQLCRLDGQLYPSTIFSKRLKLFREGWEREQIWSNIDETPQNSDRDTSFLQESDLTLSTGGKSCPRRHRRRGTSSSSQPRTKRPKNGLSLSYRPSRFNNTDEDDSVFDDSDNDNHQDQESDSQSDCRITESRTRTSLLTPLSTNTPFQTNFRAISESRDNTQERWREASMSPGTVQPASPIEYTGHDYVSRYPLKESANHVVASGSTEMDILSRQDYRQDIPQEASASLGIDQTTSPPMISTTQKAFISHVIPPTISAQTSAQMISAQTPSLLNTNNPTQPPPILPAPLPSQNTRTTTTHPPQPYQPAPIIPAPAPEKPSPAPHQPALAPEKPSPVPALAPEKPSPAPYQPAQTQKIEIVLHLWKDNTSLWSNPYSHTHIQCTSQDFFTFYAEKSQIPDDAIHQLSFSFPDAWPRLEARILDRGNEEDWESLKEKIQKLVRRQKRTVRSFEIEVEAVGWDWGTEVDEGFF